MGSLGEPPVDEDDGLEDLKGNEVSGDDYGPYCPKCEVLRPLQVLGRYL